MVRPDAVIKEELFTFLDKLAISESELRELDRPLEKKEFETVYGLLPKAGATDPLGLKMRIFGYLEASAVEKLIALLNQGLSSENFASWGENSTLVSVRHSGKRKGQKKTRQRIDSYASVPA